MYILLHNDNTVNSINVNHMANTVLKTVDQI